MCKNPQVDTDGPVVAELVADVAAAVSRRAAVVSEDVYEVILREIPELRDDESVLRLLVSSVHSNVGTCLQVMQHQIDLSAVYGAHLAVVVQSHETDEGRKKFLGDTSHALQELHQAVIDLMHTRWKTPAAAK